MRHSATQPIVSRSITAATPKRRRLPGEIEKLFTPKLKRGILAATFQLATLEKLGLEGGDWKTFMSLEPTNEMATVGGEIDGASSAGEAQQPAQSASIPKGEPPNQQAPVGSADPQGNSTENGLNRAMVWWTRVVGVFTWAGVVPLFTGLLFVAALLQSCVMRGQLAEMKAARKSGDISTASQLDMMNKQAIAMQGQLDVMKTDQRPWVGLRGIDNIPNSSAKMLVFSNGGKAPAMNASVFVSGVSEGDDTLVIPEAACESTCTFRGIELLPNVPLAVRVPRVGQPDPTADIPFWLVARIDYVDSEGHPHKTGICFRIMPDAGHSITDCPAPNSNYAD